MKHHRQWALTKHYRQWRLKGISEGTRALEAVRMVRSQYFPTPMLTRSYPRALTCSSHPREVSSRSAVAIDPRGPQRAFAIASMPCGHPSVRKSAHTAREVLCRTADCFPPREHLSVHLGSRCPPKGPFFAHFFGALQVPLGTPLTPLVRG